MKEHLADTKENGVLVKQNNRLIRIQESLLPTQFGRIRKNGKVIEPGHSAYAYLCIDLQRSALEQLSTKLEKVAEGSLSTESFKKARSKRPAFSCWSPSGVVRQARCWRSTTPRQEIEQVLDLGKNYAGMLPLSVQTEETFRGQHGAHFYCHHRGEIVVGSPEGNQVSDPTDTGQFSNAVML